MLPSYLKISTRLLLGFSFLLLLAGILGAVAIKYMGMLSQRTELFYEHPFTVSHAVFRIDGNVMRLHSTVQSMANRSGFREDILVKVKQYHDEVEKDFEIVLERFLGDKRQITQARQAYRQWRLVVEEQVTLLRDDNHREALAELRADAKEYEGMLRTQIDWVDAFIQAKAKQFLSRVSGKTKQAALPEALDTISLYLAVGNAIKQIGTDIIIMQGALDKAYLSHNDGERDELFGAVEDKAGRIQRNFTLALEGFFLEGQAMHKAQTAFEAWYSVLKQEMALLRDTQTEQNLADLTAQEKQLREGLQEEIQAVITFTSNKADSFLSYAKQLGQDALKHMYWLIGALIFVGLILAVRISRRVANPLRQAVKLSGRLGAGELGARSEAVDCYDETGQLLVAMNRLAERFQGVIDESAGALDKLAAGDMQIHLGEVFSGDFVKIKNAMENTALRLRQATNENQRQDWVKSGLSLLNDGMKGEQSIQQLAEGVMNFITPYIGAAVGVLYFFEKGEGKESCLRMIASYAYTRRKYGSEIFRLRQGFVGQAAYEKKHFVLGDVPEDYMAVASGMGQSTPESLLVMPFLYEGEVKGVIELASFELITDLQLEFMKQAMPALGVAFHTAESRAGMQALLEETKVSTE